MMSRVRYITLFEYNPVFEKIQILFKGNLLREHDLFMYSFLKPQILGKIAPHPSFNNISKTSSIFLQLTNIASDSWAILIL